MENSTLTVSVNYDPRPLREAMKARKEKQRAVALELKCHYVTLCRVLNGHNASEDLLRRLCDRLAVPFESIIVGLKN